MPEILGAVMGLRQDIPCCTAVKVCFSKLLHVVIRAFLINVISRHTKVLSYLI